MKNDNEIARINEIKNVVDNDIRFGLFEDGKFKEASVILKRLYMKHYSYIEDVRTKFNILYHLSLAEYHSNENKTDAKNFIEIIKNEIETSLFYINNKLEYSRVLNLHTELWRDEIDDEEYREIYYLISENYESIGNFSEKAIALCNIYALDKDYKGIFNLLEELIERNEENVGYYSMELLKEIKDSSLHNSGLALIRKLKIS